MVPFIWYFAGRDTFDTGRAIAILVIGLLLFCWTGYVVVVQ